MVRLRKQGQAEAKRIWRSVSPDDLDGTFNVGLLELTVQTLQREAARLSSAYLASFVASELGEPQNPPALSVWDKTFNGNDLREGLRSAIVTAKLAIKDGTDPREATKASRKILVSDVGLFIDTAARESLRQGMEMDDRIVGYQRALKGTCGACSGSTSYEAFSPNAPVVPLMYHPNCQCVSEPIVNKGGVPAQQTPRVDQVAGEALRALQRHRWPVSDPIPIVLNPKSLHGAIFKHGPKGGVEIKIPGKAGVHPSVSDVLAHEAGHWLDYLMMGGNKAIGGMTSRGKVASFLTDAPSAAMKNFIKAARDSRAYRNWDGDVTTPREMWARAYQQWVMGHRHRTPPGFEGRLKYDPYQWDDDDFGPIAKAIEGVLKEQGLLD